MSSLDPGAADAGADETRKSLDARLAEIQNMENADDARFFVIRAQADALVRNIQDIYRDQTMLFELNRRSEDMQVELAQLRTDLDRILIPALDDQVFYTITGYRQLDQPPSHKYEHFTEAEFERFRHVSQMQADSAIATQLLANAFNVSDASSIEPLKERFEAAKSHIERSLGNLEGVPVKDETTPIYGRLFELALADDSGFELLAQRQRLVQHQRELLAYNQDIAVDLVAEVNNLVAASEFNAQQATASSERAIFTGQWLLTAIAVVSIVGALIIAWMYVGRVIVSRLQKLSDRMRSMSSGDLQSEIEVEGSDEIADMAAALEVFRQHALEIQRLNLVELLAEELKEKNDELETVLTDLRKAQDQIVIREKLAALGELTAGVAHEIRNPLNFVKNFSESSDDLLAELRETLEESADSLEQSQQELVDEISGELVSNLERIRFHGERAERIVNDMLLMGRESGAQQPTDLNRLLDQNARLAYHSARARDPEFQLDIKEEMDPEVGEVTVVAQGVGRVFLNMVANACDATAEKRAGLGMDSPYAPTLWLATKRTEEDIEIRIRDNGNGMPPEVIDKIFNPFFTTKPTDKGTGLGLSISNDIVQQHGGEIQVTSEAGEFTEMLIRIPAEPVMVEGGGIHAVRWRLPSLTTLIPSFPRRRESRSAWRKLRSCPRHFWIPAFAGKTGTRERREM